MKLKVEEKDIKDVKMILLNYYGVKINDEQSKCLIESNEDLTHNLHKWGCYETETRSLIFNSLLKEITKGYKKTLRCPLNGDSPEYKVEFDVVFKQAAKIANIELDKCWY